MMQCFYSLGYGFWPVQLVLINLPPNIRFNRKYIILTSLWYGPTKPNMEVLLKPTLSKLTELYEKGIIIKTTDGSKIMKCKLLIGVFDIHRYCCTHFNRLHALCTFRCSEAAFRNVVGHS